MNRSINRFFSQELKILNRISHLKLFPEIEKKKSIPHSLFFHNPYRLPLFS